MASNLQKTLHDMYESSYTSICQKENLSNNPLSHYQLYIEDKSKYVFKTSFNANANFIKIKNGKKYLKFSLAINLLTKEDKKEIQKRNFNKGLISLYERGESNRTSVEVYSDGIKIPDDETFITLYNGSLDLYVLDKYVSNNTYLDIVCKKYNKQEKFFNIIIRNRIAKAIEFVVPGNELINLNDIKIFKNGLLLTRDLDYKLINMNNLDKIRTVFGNDVKTSDVVEIILDKFCVHYYSKIEDEDNILTVPNNILPNLPISLDICKVFTNGKRLFNRDIELLSPRTFRIKNFIDKSKVLFYINYNDLYDLEGIIYNEDGIKVFNSLTEEEIKDIFINNKPVNNYLDWIKDLDYPSRPINIIPNPNLLRDRTHEEFVDDTIKEFLKDNAHNIVPLLNGYKETERKRYDFRVSQLEKRKTTKQELGTFSVQVFRNRNYLMAIPKLSDKFFIMGFADNIKLDDDYLTIKEFNGTIYIYIDEKYLEDKDTISLVVTPIINMHQSRVNFTVLQMQDQSILVEKLLLGNIYNLDDIIIMKHSEDSFILQIKNIDYTIEDKGENLLITFINKKLLEEFVIYNSSFFEKDIVNIKEETIIHRLDKEYPYYSNYTIEVYNNGKLMLEDIDYFISNQENTEGLNESLLVFKNCPQENDKLEIYHLETYKKPFSFCKALNSEKYDLVYFTKDRHFGYGKEYIDLYINDILVDPSNIVPIALNLVAIEQENIPRPYKYISTRSKFDKEVVNVEKYIDYYNENTSKFATYIDNLVKSNNYKEIDKIVDRIYPEIKERMDNGLLVDNRNLIDPLLDEIAKRLREGSLDRRIDANKNQPLFNQIEFLKLMDYIQKNSSEISIDSNLDNLKQGLEIAPNDTLVPLEELNYIVAMETEENNFPYGMNFEAMTDEEYEKHNISNKLYLEEIKFANLNINIPETIIIDANDIEEEYSLKEVSKIIDIKFIKKVLNPNENNLFFYRLSVKNLLIEDLVSFNIGSYNAILDVDFDSESKVINIYTNIDPNSTIEIKYLQRVYNE